MKRRFQGLQEADQIGASDIPEGVFLVRIERVQYRTHAQKPYYSVRFKVVEPKEFVDQILNGRLYCTRKALWKLTWFLRDFGYDQDLLSHNEIDDKRLVGLEGVIKTSRFVRNGASLTLDGFAVASQWQARWASGRPEVA